MRHTLALEEIEQALEPARILGSGPKTLEGIATLSEAGPTDLSFLGNKKYRSEVAESRAGLLLLPEDFAGEPPEGQAWLLCKQPSLALARLCRILEARLWDAPEPGVHPSAVVHPEAKVDASATIGPLCVLDREAEVGPKAVLGAGVSLGRAVRVGEASRLQPGVRVLDYCEVGARCYLNAGCVLGSEGFGYEFVDNQHERVPQIGRVVLEDEVDIGANTTIDRARFGETRIGAGSKVDNLVQIAHNVVIGRNSIIVAQVGISGSTTIGDYCIIGGQVGIAGHLKLADKCQIGAQSGLNHDLEEGSYVRGTPVYPFMQAHRLDILKGRLPELFKRVAKVEELLEHLGTAEVKSTDE